jgi:hypothetical protein
MPDRNLTPTRLRDNPHQVESTQSATGAVISAREAASAKDALRLALRAVHQIGNDLGDTRLVAIALRGLLCIRALN